MFKYLLAVDGSTNSRKATEYLAKLTELRNDLDITILYVINIKKEIQKLANSSTEIPEIEKEVIENGWHIINKEAAVFEKIGYGVKKQLINGNPSHKITEIAKLNEFNHIVLGTRGSTDLKGLVLGSVSHHVLHLSHCPVTLVK